MNEELLKRVCNTPGISGFEDKIQDIVASELRMSCRDVRRDRLGNVIALKKATNAVGERPRRVVLAAHEDDIEATIRLLTAFLEHAHLLDLNG
jgi:endoglucanase